MAGRELFSSPVDSFNHFNLLLRMPPTISCICLLLIIGVQEAFVIAVYLMHHLDSQKAAKNLVK